MAALELPVCRWGAWLLAGALGLVLSGCGGPSAANMRKYALRNAPEPEAPAPPPPAAPGTGAVAATAQTTPSATTSGASASAPRVREPEPPAAAAVAPAQATSASSVAVEPAPASAPTPPAVRGATNPEQSAADRRARSITNLERIGQALARYVAKHGRLPPPAITNEDGEPLLSWRVLLLPELGYQELYGRFRLDERWDSPHNRPLLAHVPPEFQSPERGDTKTNYVGVAGIGMPLGTAGGLAASALKDGLSNTLAVLEVDDRYAQEWTQPVDFRVSLDEPGDGLGGLREDGTFAVLANGRVVLLPRGLPEVQLAALYTPLGGEPVNADIVLKSPGAAAAIATTSAASGATGRDSASSAAAPPSGPIDRESDRLTLPALPPSLAGGAEAPRDAAKSPVPDQEALDQARKFLQDVYREQYAQARTAAERQQFTKKLLQDAAQVEDSAAEYYELVRIARELAAQTGDAQSVLAASDRLEERFQLDPIGTRLQPLTELSKQTRAPQAAAVARKEVHRLGGAAFAQDRYDDAMAYHELELVFARLEGQDKGALARLQQRRESLEAAKRLLAGAQAAAGTLRAQPEDPAACAVLGRYLCFVKNDWERGLPYLARGADIKLRLLALIDLEPARQPAETLSLADQYWELAQQIKPPEKRGLHLRAVTHYTAAAAQLGNTLPRIKARKRLEEAARLYDPEEIAAASPSAAGESAARVSRD